jgi:alkyl hydroperoxide reductase subunit AhpC
MATYTSKAWIRRPAPAFTATAWDGNRIKEISLEQYKGKYVVLFFYPLDFTFVCPTEICNFNDLAPEFRAIECELIACSVDSIFSHREYTLKPRDNGGLGKMQIPILSDINKQIGKDYGVYLDHSGDEGVNLRGTFIIDREGILRHISINDLPVGRNSKEILRLVQAFQYTDVYGEVCPESWQPGSATMVPDHDSEKLQGYWQSEHSKPS